MTRLKSPRIINLPITEICDSKCVMCNVWSAGKEDEYSPDKIKKIFGQKIFSKVEHVGISGGEPTLNSDLLEICITILNVFPKLKTLSMTSHGYHLDKHIKLLPLIKNNCKKRGVVFSLNLSLDGIEEVHVKIRRISKAFDKVISTAKFAKSQNIHVQFQCTISPINVYNIVHVREYALKNNYEVIFRIASYIARLSNGDLEEKIKLSFKEKSFVADFLDSERTIMAANSLGRRLFYGDLAKRLRDSSPRSAPCAFQKEALFVSPNESIYNCSRSEQELEIPNILKIEDSLNSENNKKVLTDLIKDTCSDCYHDQSGRWELWRYLTVHNLLYNKYQLLVKLSFVPEILSNAFFPIDKNEISFKKPLESFLIIGCYGGEHVGDAAILGGVILRLIENYKLKKITVLSIRKDRTICWVNNLDFPNINISVIDNSTNLIATEYDALCLAGGPIMGIPTLLSQHLTIIKKFKSKKLPFLVEGVGIGPFKTRITNLLAKKIISMADTLTVRTNVDYVKAKKIVDKVILTKDPAFDYLKYIEPNVLKYHDKSLGKILNTGKEIWVINLRPLWKAYTSKGTNIENSENELLVNLVKVLKKYKSDKRFVFMTMNADQFGFSDLEMAYSLKDLIRELDNEIDFKIWEYEPDINDCVFLLKKASLTISMRFHGCIFSLANNIPTIGIDYSTSERGKVYSLFKDFNKEDQVININDFSSQGLETIIQRVYEGK